MKRRIYLDYAATTPVAPEVLEEMLPFLTSACGNPSSVHAEGREAKKALENARRKIAAGIGAEPQEIYFTSGGTESDNWALKGAAFAGRHRGNRILISAVEHHAVLDTCAWLEKQGFEIVRMPVDRYGWLDPETVRRMIDDRTILISVMTANNEIGTIQPVAEIGAAARERGIPFHTDAVQAVGSIPVDVRKMNADMLSLSGHKIYGPKGIGALYVRRGIRIDSLLNGGSQERGLRAGTENVAGAAGLGKAMELAVGKQEEESCRLSQLRDGIISSVLNGIPGASLNGHPERRLPNNCSFTFDRIESEALLLRLDLYGISASGGSACTSGSVDPSHVLLALGMAPEKANGSIRLTLGKHTTREDTMTAAERLSEIVRDLRLLRDPEGCFSD